MRQVQSGTLHVAGPVEAGHQAYTIILAFEFRRTLGERKRCQRFAGGWQKYGRDVLRLTVSPRE